MQRLVRLVMCNLLSLLACLITLSFPAISWAAAQATPNFLVILADDLGFSDFGCYGGEISTPNIDALAQSGLRYSQFYNTARCWPTRAALLTGYYAQQVGRDKLPVAKGEKQSRPFNQRRPRWSQLLPEMLSPLGYRSYHSGKWHVDGKPLSSGFDRSYQLHAIRGYFAPARHTLDDKKIPADQEDYYVTTAIADNAIEFLRDHKENSPDQPFFEFVAFTAPHFPLHAPAEDRERYSSKYDSGWDVARASRWQKLKQVTEIPGKLSALEPTIGTPYPWTYDEAKEILGPGEVNVEVPWATLTDEQKSFQATKMSIHAAMIDRMDREIGRIVEQLRSSGDLENTVIMVLSDNGASAEIMVRGDGHDPAAAPGSAATYLCLGAGWSSAANTPFRRHKTWVHEGGIATPMIVHWPAGITAPGEWRSTVGHVIDIAPTIMSLAGGVWPATHNELPVPPTPGLNFMSTFASDNSLERDALWWLHEGNRAIRDGDWKLVAAKDSPWELYDLGNDRTETTNLAKQLPNRVAKLAQQWEARTAEFALLRDQSYESTTTDK